MGPDHSQIEIYEESKHGVMFEAQEKLLNLKRRTEESDDARYVRSNLRHLSHERTQRRGRHARSVGATVVLPGERDQREASATTPAAQAKMKQVCAQCHTPRSIDPRLRAGREGGAGDERKSLAAQGIWWTACATTACSTGPPFSQPIDFVYFDFWHYDGRTAKHGAFMGGADFVQWHGNYPMLRKTAELKAMATSCRKSSHGRQKIERGGREPWLLVEAFCAGESRLSDARHLPGPLGQ